jgi:signal transduction histidine kinase/ABC-type uncharacterized transport system substrate-binding protein
MASGIRDRLHKDWSYRASVEPEHVDVANFAAPEEEERRLRTIFAIKYGNRHFDVIVAVLPEAFRFVLRTRDDLWPGTPVVVCGVDERSVRDLKPPPGFAVLTIRFDVEGTVRAANALLPDTRHVAIVGGASPREQIYHDLIRQAVSTVGGLDVIDLTRLPIGDVLARVSSLPEQTVIVHSIYQVDGASRRLDGSDLVSHVSNAANRPAFSSVTLTLGQGVVGGSVIDFEDVGRDAGRMAARVLRGETPPSAPVPSSAIAVPRFDGRQLARWNLDERRLPEGSQIIFREPTLWQIYRWYVLGAVGLIAAQAALIAALLVQRRRRREAQADLTERLRFEMLVSEIITGFGTATPDQLDQRIRDCLRRMGTFLGIDRITLWQRAQETSLLMHAWERSGTPPRATFQFQRFAYLRTRLEAGDIVCFTSPDDLPLEAAAERTEARAVGVRSFAAIPLRAGDRLLGVLVLLSLHAERRWPVHIVQQLWTLAQPFSTALIRIQSAAAVEHSAAMAGAILAALPGETAIIDSTGTIIETNEAWATAARSGTAAPLALQVGANYLDACRSAVDIPPDIGRTLHASIESVLRGEREEFVVEYPTSRRGEDCRFEVRVRRLTHFGGGAAVMHFDVTARRQAETAARLNLSQIAHLDRVAAMGQLASSIAHELNQPLTAILANAQAAKRLLARSQPNLDEVLACLADIVSDNRRASDVIQRMRQLLKKADVIGVPLALNELVANTIRLVTNDALLHAVTIVFLPAPDLPLAHGDPVQIQQVILNLLTNAIAASASNGAAPRKVTVWTSKTTTAYVELCVHDSGEGVKEADLDRIFDPFFSTKPDGLGVGLAISRTIVDVHGGRLIVENDPAGGATFRVRLRIDQSGQN